MKRHGAATREDEMVPKGQTPRERNAWLAGYDCGRTGVDGGWRCATYAEVILWDEGRTAAEAHREEDAIPIDDEVES